MATRTVFSEGTGRTSVILRPGPQGEKHLCLRNRREKNSQVAAGAVGIGELYERPNGPSWHGLAKTRSSRTAHPLPQFTLAPKELVLWVLLTRDEKTQSRWR
jgi:hypothetical protein